MNIIRGVQDHSLHCLPSISAGLLHIFQQPFKRNGAPHADRLHGNLLLFVFIPCIGAQLSATRIRVLRATSFTFKWAIAVGAVGSRKATRLFFSLVRVPYNAVIALSLWRIYGPDFFSKKRTALWQLSQETS